MFYNAGEGKLGAFWKVDGAHYPMKKTPLVVRRCNLKGVYMRDASNTWTFPTMKDLWRMTGKPRKGCCRLQTPLEYGCQAAFSRSRMKAVC